jgi:peptidoglycan/LPS O-acetylase OafA/YrhL
MSDGDGETASQFVLVGQGWSLGLEIWFYLMAPFVVRSPRRTVIWLVLALVLFAATELWVEEGIWGFWVEESVWKYSWKYRFFPCIMVFFAIGALSFHLREFYRGHSIRKKIDPVALKVFFPLTFGFLVFPDLMSLIVAPQHHLKLLLLIALPCLPIWFEATRNIRIDRLLGELSYPIYLNHTLIILLTAPLVAEGGNESVRSILVLLISTAMAYAMYRFIEQPINGWRQRRVKSREDLPVPAAPGP